MSLYPVIRDANELTPASQCLHHFRASDRVLRTVDGQGGALTRAVTVLVDDNVGGSFYVGYHQPAFDQKQFTLSGVPTWCHVLRLASTDRLYFPCEFRPQAMGFYWNFLHYAPATNEALVSISNDAVSGARFLLDWSASGKYRAAFHNGTSDSAIALSGTAPTTGQSVELWGWLFDNGTNMWVQLNQSIDNGAVQSTATSTPVTRASAWGTGAKLRYSAHGTSAGATAWHRIGKLIPGAPTLAQLLRTF